MMKNLWKFYSEKLDILNVEWNEKWAFEQPVKNESWNLANFRTNKWTHKR